MTLIRWNVSNSVLLFLILVAIFLIYKMNQSSIEPEDTPLWLLDPPVHPDYDRHISETLNDSLSVNNESIFQQPSKVEVNDDEEFYPPKLDDPPNLIEFLYPKEPWTNVDIKMQYIINNDVCSSFIRQIHKKEGPEILIINLVQTAGSNRKIRDTIRESIPKEVLEQLGIRRIFLLAQPDPHPNTESGTFFGNPVKKGTSLKDLILEHEEHQDLLVGDFLETYKNLVYKTIMGFDWVTKYCPQAKFIVKQDDDIVSDLYQIHRLLSQVLEEGQYPIRDTLTDEWGYLKKDPAHHFITSIRRKMAPQSKDRRFIMGTYSNGMVERKKSHKFYVPFEQYPNETWPLYSGGMAYVTTVETVRDLVKVSTKVPFFWIEDVHITGFLRKKAGIEYFSMRTLTTYFTYRLECCLTHNLAGDNKLDLQLEHDMEEEKKLKLENQGHEVNVNENPTRRPAREFLRPKWCHFLFGQAPSDLTFITKFHSHSKFCHESQLCARVESFKRQLSPSVCKGIVDS